MRLLIRLFLQGIVVIIPLCFSTARFGVWQENHLGEELRLADTTRKPSWQHHGSLCAFSPIALNSGRGECSVGGQELRRGMGMSRRLFWKTFPEILPSMRTLKRQPRGTFTKANRSVLRPRESETAGLIYKDLTRQHWVTWGKDWWGTALF